MAFYVINKPLSRLELLFAKRSLHVFIALMNWLYELNASERNVDNRNELNRI